MSGAQKEGGASSRGGVGRQPGVGGCRSQEAALVRQVSQGREAETEDTGQLGVESLAARLTEPGIRMPQRLLYIHHLNNRLAEAQDFSRCMKLVQLLPQHLLPDLLTVVSSGEAQVFTALNLLHFLSFHPPHRSALLEAQALPILLGLLRCKPERELAHAALSLMVSLVQEPVGCGFVGQLRGVGAVAAGFLVPPTSLQTRSMALHLIRALLRSPQGRVQATQSNPLHQAFTQALGHERVLDSEKKQLTMVLREIDFFRGNLASK